MKHLTKVSLGSKLKVLREAVHMEQEILSRVLNIPRTAICAIESGKRDVTVMELIELCKVFRITPNDLLNWQSYQTRRIAGGGE